MTVGTNRFAIRRTLGEGGMGVVYEAHDTARDMTVALKTLRTIDATLLYHFKNEFRSLADLHHVNLVSLYELFETEGQWFFTMELVEGCDFTTWIRPRDDAEARRSAPTLPAVPAGSGTILEWAVPATLPSDPVIAVPRLPFDEARLRSALVQLAEGLNALHAAGKVHRDIKPGNIQVTPGGRVVIMDFGLAADETLLAEFASGRIIAGTPTFMAPEQSVPGAQVGTAADWFAVGVMLYEVLTSRLPFSGSTFPELLAAKHTPPPAPSAVAANVPHDLADLCSRLLAPAPEARPTGDEVLRILGGKQQRPAMPADVFVGRRTELGILHTALADSRKQAVTVFVEGPSGLGKSALVRRFLDEVAGGGTMILKGRCYAEEAVPYKAFDGIVDALSRNLLAMPPSRVATLVPRSAALVARLFPVLQRVPAFAQEDAIEGAGLELRARAFAALVELFGRVAASQPLLLFIDDLQWADADSMLLLRELIYPPSAPQLALVASVRTGEARPDPGGELAQLARIEPRRLLLAPLAADDAALLVDRLLPREGSERRQAIAREAAGHPLFLAELAHHLASHGGTLTTRLDDALWDRALALEHDERHLLQIIAIAGTPIDHKTAADASGLTPTRSAPMIAALRGERFVKTSMTSAGENVVEPYHDRVRESVVSRMDRVLFAQMSGRLAHAMLRAGMGETAPELVVRHLFAAGDAARGRDLAERAAARALGALAFDRAAAFLRSALSAGPRDAAHARALHLALAEALASGGRGAEAADAFLAAGAEVDDEARLDCRRHAADQLLASGHVDRGLTELAGVLAQLGERVPESPGESLASLETMRTAIDAAPIVLYERAIADIPPALLRKLDVYQSTSLGLILVDNVRGADFQARAVRLAIGAGDPRRLLRALVFEAIYRAQEGASGRMRAVDLLNTAGEIARNRRDPWMDAYLVLASAFSAYYAGRFRHAVVLFEDADVRFRTLPHVAWEQNTVRLHRLRATDYQGAWGKLRALYDEYLRDAQRRDDRYVEASITRWFNVLWLAHDRPDLAGADLDRNVWAAPEEGRYHLQHFLELRARVELALYRGEGAAQGAWARPGLAAAERSHLLRIQIARAIADWLLGRIAACEGAIPEIELRAKKLTEHRINYATIWSGLLTAAAMAQRGDRAAAIAKLDAIAGMADEQTFPLCAAIARVRAGQLAGDDLKIAAAVAWMTTQEIRDPIRMCEVFAPGFL